MLKLTKTSVGTALAAAILLGSSSAYATLTFDLELTSGGSTASASAGSTIPLTLYAVFTGTGNGVYDLGGSFLSSGVGGSTSGFNSATVSPAVAAVGSQTGSVYNPGTNTIWGGSTIATAQYNSAGFFYTRSANSGVTGATSPVLGNKIALGTINYVVSAADAALSSVTLSFVARDRPGVVDQLWQENGVVTDDTTGTIAYTGTTLTFGPSVSTWTAVGSGKTWETAGNWSSAPADSATTAVLFGATGATGAVTVGAAHTVNSIEFNGNSTYAVTGTGSIALAGTTPTIKVDAGSHVISVPVVITAAGLTKTGAGTVGLNNLRTASTVSISGGKIVINAAGGAAGMSKVGGLSITGGASLDLTTNSIIISGTTVGAVQGLLGTGIVSSSTTPGTTSLGYASGGDSQVGGLGNLLNGQSFGPTDVLVKYTYAGDSNLDGTVSFADFSNLQNAYGTLSGAVWDQGDFNGDGSVNFADFSILQNNYNSTPAILSAGGLTSGLAAVPEPTSLALLGLGAAGLMARRRR